MHNGLDFANTLKFTSCIKEKTYEPYAFEAALETVPAAACWLAARITEVNLVLLHLVPDVETDTRMHYMHAGHVHATHK